VYYSPLVLLEVYKLSCSMRDSSTDWDNAIAQQGTGTANGASMNSTAVEHDSTYETNRYSAVLSFWRIPSRRQTRQAAPFWPIRDRVGVPREGSTAGLRCAHECTERGIDSTTELVACGGYG
jgi:hypothetical protein